MLDSDGPEIPELKTYEGGHRGPFPGQTKTQEDYTMKIKQFYGSLVGNHFEEMSIRLLCSLIDQRLENGIPSLKLRMSLLEEIKRLNGMPNRWVTERQRNIEQKIVKDIRSTQMLNLLLSIAPISMADSFLLI